MSGERGSGKFATAAGVMLEHARIAVVGTLDTAALERAGASIVNLGAAEFWTAHDPDYDLVLIAGLEPDRASAFVRELRSHARTRSVPRLVVTDAAAADGMLRIGGVALADPTADFVALAGELLPSRREPLDDGAARIVELEEDLRRASRELEEWRRDRNMLVHDGRVLLAVALGFACNLRDGITGELDEVQRSAATRIAAAVQEASALIARAPAVASESTRGPAKRAPKRNFVRLDTLVSDAAALFEEMASERGIHLEHAANDETAFSVWCDPLAVKQVVVNLVVNALKFTPRGGRVRVSTEKATASGEGTAARSGARIVVADSGPGIPAADRERIFERGARLERDSDKPGQGIGLAIVREVAFAHRGTVEVGESPLGGTTFEIRLPLDLRRRESAGVLLAVESPQARELARILGDSSVEALSAASEEFVPAALAAKAMVLLPRGSEEMLEELVRHLTRS